MEVKAVVFCAESRNNKAQGSGNLRRGDRGLRLQVSPCIPTRQVADDQRVMCDRAPAPTLNGLSPPLAGRGFQGAGRGPLCSNRVLVSDRRKDCTSQAVYRKSPVDRSAVAAAGSLQKITNISAGFGRHDNLRIGVQIMDDSDHSQSDTKALKVTASIAATILHDSRRADPAPNARRPI
jgi:hypothetical protein